MYSIMVMHSMNVFHIMAEPDTIYNIFSRMPIKSLARFRCVSKLWCEYIDSRHLTILHGERSAEDPTPLIYYEYLNPPRIVNFHITKSKEGATLLEPKKDHFIEFDRYERSVYICPSSMVQECYKLPLMYPCLPWSFELMKQEYSCGLGFDASTNTFKMVCVVSIEQGYPDGVRKNLCTMVHVLGTDSWRKRPQVPAHLIAGEGVFAHGSLHWLNKYVVHDYRREVTCFDVIKEEFRVINPPKGTKGGPIFNELVDLHGEVGYACYYFRHSLEVWVLKGKEWAIGVAV
ncbi:hypothetical protein L1987_33570 [Smallanthus sonchifolius]|uniref:Uncharacterized protein n=1 Tax=Smallanthus sonchifolius TaxID=185202 RepID=A0ACB9HR79_9ASTR|nr:hypothetical protein L1987_33570 [Smallanthus sonchifolius]